MGLFGEASAVDPLSVQFKATTALPYDSVDRASAGLRAALRQQLLTARVRGLPAWETFVVTGPIEFTDQRGRTWYEYRATMEGSGAKRSSAGLA